MMKVSLDKKETAVVGPEMEPLLQLISISRSLLPSLPHVKQNRPHLLSFFQMLVCPPPPLHPQVEAEENLFFLFISKSLLTIKCLFLPAALKKKWTVELILM